MRLLADENLPRDVIDALRRGGHDVARIRADSPEREDEQVLERATAEQRTLITADTDFGEIVFRSLQRADSGVILLRIGGLPREQSAALMAALATRDDWSGHFAVVARNRLRVIRIQQDDG